MSDDSRHCLIYGRSNGNGANHLVGQQLVLVISEEHRDWSPEAWICSDDLVR